MKGCRYNQEITCCSNCFQSWYQSEAELTCRSFSSNFLGTISYLSSNLGGSELKSPWSFQRICYIFISPVSEEKVMWYKLPCLLLDKRNSVLGFSLLQYWLTMLKIQLIFRSDSDGFYLLAWHLPDCGLNGCIYQGLEGCTNAKPFYFS